MLSIKLIALLAAIVGFSGAVPTPGTHSLHEKRNSLPRLWARGDRVDRNAILPVRIGLAQQNMDDSYDHLMDV
tara:strand:+ start:748 stop:966 length:219 start_codon:yes stop_codon:yes gene_type:complete